MDNAWNILTLFLKHEIYVLITFMVGAEIDNYNLSNFRNGNEWRHFL